ncbi:hypothetical protein [Mycoplasma todarodis]|uniref:Uncharacterized protein n=1 Tax=Mycoplasma todarodis TaxID=1937191 RepID=A0A4R0XJ14_9MOLU|nr:hypothetical protein [Mycoplasma todarodis]TCG10593.1 hypothetical protein C4B25_03560 [Mycoplasma todarodis]
MKSKIFKFTKKHIYVFGILANIIPLIGMIAMLCLGEKFSYLNLYQVWAWIAGAIYYVFMWSVALFMWKKVDSSAKEVDATMQKIEALEKRIKELEEK